LCEKAAVQVARPAHPQCEDMAAGFWGILDCPNLA
jgi:hypothetical protein